MTTSEPLATRLFQLRIVVGALIFGVISFAGVAFFLAGDHGLGNQRANADLPRMLLLVLGVLGLGLVAGYPIVRKTIVGALRSRWRGGGEPVTDDPQLLQSFQTLTIVGAAMAEGFALFSGVIYLLSAHPVALAGIALGLLSLSRFFPTAASYAKFCGEITTPGVS